jgi:hypothetical protein
MANFHTHLTAAMVTSGFAATLCLRANEITNEDALSCFVVGVVGGILPDVDSDNSTAIKLIFNVVAIAACGAFILGCSTRFSVYHALLLVVSIYTLIRFGAAALFSKLTVHRGMFHSLVAAVLSGFITASVAHHNFAYDALHAWLLGVFMSGGYILHLILDEIYSVDLLNRKIKRSFGSAIKVGGDFKTTAAAVVVAALLYSHGPSSEPINLLLSRHLPSWTSTQTATSSFVSRWTPTWL